MGELTQTAAVVAVLWDRASCVGWCLASLLAEEAHLSGIGKSRKQAADHPTFHFVWGGLGSGGTLALPTNSKQPPLRETVMCKLLIFIGRFGESGCLSGNERECLCL